jgi:hypothetical protein
MESLILTDDQIDQITQEVEDITQNNSKSVEELYATIGNSIHYSSNYKLAHESSKNLLEAVANKQSTITISKAVNLLSGSPSLTYDAAVEGGENFWQRMKNKIKEFVCSSEIIRKFFEEGGTLKDAIKTLIPAIIAALGLSAANPLLLAAIVAIISLLIKEGYSKFCDIPTK